MKPKTKKPIQYLKGYCEFYKLKFFLTPDSLIPRPETELLVDEILKLAHSSQFTVHNEATNNDERTNKLTIIDLGTGSGNIAISVAKNLPAGRQGLPGVKIIAIDVSEKALEVARKNAKFHKVEDQIIFLKSDLLDYLMLHLGGVTKVPDIIVTNLPYIPTARLLHIDPMVTEWEPRVALDGGIDGFELYRKLFTQMRDKNITPKYLFGEIDYTHGEIAISEANKYFPNAEVSVKTDLAHKQRILTIKF